MYDASTAWNAAKVIAFREAFEVFLYYVKIDSKEEGEIPLGGHLYDAQLRFLDAVFDALAHDIHDIYVLKSRQLGLSTVSRALTVFWIGMHPGLRGSVILDSPPHRDDARREIEEIISRLPASLNFPAVKSANRDSLRLMNGSVITFMAAGTKKTQSSGAMGRGIGTNFCHCSEMATWQNPEGVSSFRKTLAKDYPNRLYIWESTGRGFNQWYDLWKDARIDEFNKRCVFLGWWSKPNQRLLKGTAAYKRYAASPITELEQKRIDEVWELYQHKVDMEQLAWYRKESNPQNFKREDGEEDELEFDDDGLSDDEYFGREQPWVEEEAFSQTGSTFFSAESLTKITKEMVSSTYSAWRYFAGTEFVLMRVDKAHTKRETQLKVWEEPRPEGVYVIAADPAFGENENNDRSSIQVLRCYADKIEQVAEFCSPSVQPHQFAWVIASLMGYYKKVRFILEINGPGGAVFRELTLLKQIVTQGYAKEEAIQHDLKNVFNNCKNYLYSRIDALIPGQGVLHWKTSSQNKVSLMERARDFASNGTAIIRSAELVDEMRQVTRDGDTIKSEGSDHDDRVLALAMGIMCWEQMERRTLIAMGRTREFEIAKNRLTVQDQMALLNKYHLSRYFDGKAKARRQAAAAARQQAWRNR